MSTPNDNARATRRALRSGGARRRRRDERGAVLVEVVMIVPLLMMITLGVFDLGLGWKASLTVTNAARSGARVASNLGVSSAADKSALIAIAASLGTIPVGEIDYVVIYRATSADGHVPSQCVTPAARTAGGNSGSQCNVYTGAEVFAAASASTFTGSCGASRDRFWCPSTRANNQGSVGGPDYVGVYVRIKHATKTKLFGPTMVVEDQAVMRVEPNAGNT